MDSTHKEPKAPRAVLKQKEENYAHPTAKQHADDRALNQGKECPPQAAPAAQKASQATSQRSSTCRSFRCEVQKKDYFMRDLPTLCVTISRRLSECMKWFSVVVEERRGFLSHLSKLRCILEQVILKKQIRDHMSRQAGSSGKRLAR
jgi:chemotaxis protein histidine kinase CheA